MRKTMMLWLCAAAAVAGCAAPALAQDPPKSHKPVPFDTNVKTWIVPAVQSWRGDAGSLVLTSQSRIVLGKGVAADMRDAAMLFSADLRALSGLALPVVAGAARAGDIVIQPGAATGVASDSPEAYAITIGDRITVRARGQNGVLYGLQSVLQLLKHDEAARALPRGEIRDWPDYRRRAMFVDIGRKYFEIAELDDLMRQMAWLKLNTLGLHFNDWPAFRLRSDKFPGLADRQSYTRADVEHLEATAKRYGIIIIPEIDLPAHASALIRYKPSLGFKCESMRQSGWLSRSAGPDAANLAWTVDITKQENRDWMKSLLNEFIPWFKGPYFHIGGDEYQYDESKNRCPELLEYAKQRGFPHPGDVFVDWINDTDKLVRAHGKTSAIWNWWRFKDDKTSIQPNKDILIYAWNSPRLKDIIDTGYQVMVTPEDKLYVVPGIENFDGSNYGVVDSDAIYTAMPLEKGPRVEGYMVALWNDAAEHHTDRYLLGKSYEPMSIMAERQWSGQGSVSLDAFLARLNKAGSAPRPAPVK